jgi:hypothetical protein
MWNRAGPTNTSSTTTIMRMDRDFMWGLILGFFLGFVKPLKKGKRGYKASVLSLMETEQKCLVPFYT